MLDRDKVYRVKGFGGVACRFVGYPQRFEPYVWYDDDGDYTEHGGEWVDDLDSGRVLMVMVGDDHKHSVFEADCEPIDELDYCTSCGQIGCAHDGRDRS